LAFCMDGWLRNVVNIIRCNRGSNWGCTDTHTPYHPGSGQHQSDLGEVRISGWGLRGAAPVHPPPLPFSALFRFHRRLTTCDSSQDSLRPFRPLQLSPHSGRSGISSPLVLSLSHSTFLTLSIPLIIHILSTSTPLHPPRLSKYLYTMYVHVSGTKPSASMLPPCRPPLSIHMHNPLIRHPFPTTCIACSCTVRSQIPHRHMYMSVSAVA
jgi:hypothetical protein